MQNLLFISHRIPYPLTKGEKIRAYNLVTHFAKSYRVHLGCLVEDPTDWQHLDHLETIDRRWQKLKALARMRPGRPLMLGYY
ncbi:MAG: glycosyl transferase, partial [Acetobacteraceae bacterium]|nr:glycosyl transferase [Acetobacteraceae bacterium]